MSSRIGAVILAAGASTRLGQPKQLALFHGKTLLAHAIEAALGASCSKVVVVLGAGAERIRPEIESSSVQIVLNPDWEQGMGGSIRTGISALQEDAEVEAAALLLCDQPLVTTATIVSLLKIRAATSHAIIASEYDGVPGPPCIFARALFPELLTLTGAEGARRIIQRQERNGAVYRKYFPEGATDIDTLDDLKRLQERALTEPSFGHPLSKKN